MRFVRIIALVMCAGWLFVGCAALNGVNQALNNVIGSTASTAAKAVNTLAPPAQKANTTYSQFKTTQQYQAEQQKKTDQYNRRHPLRDKHYQPTSHPQKKVKKKKPSRVQINNGPPQH
jgi:N-acetylmuramoyl-L-alanine amidase CwlA